MKFRSTAISLGEVVNLIIMHGLNLSFKIGEVSKILNIPIDTLRYYDKIGLVHPHKRGINNYRYYDLEQFDLLSTIRMLRAMDVPIKQVAAFLSEDNLNDIRRWLLNQQGDIKQQINYLKNLSIKLESLKTKLERFENTDVIELVQMEPCWVLLTDSIMESDDPDLGNKIQRMIHNLDGDQEWLSFCHIISIVSKENLNAGMYHTYLNNGILSPFPVETDTGVFQRLEPRYCAKKYVVIEREGYQGPDGLGQQYEEMKAFIHKRGLQIAGNSLEVNLYNQYNKHYIEINIPVAEQSANDE